MHFQSSLAALALLVSSAWADSSTMSVMSDTATMMSSSTTLMSSVMSEITTMTMSSSSSVSKPTTTMSSSTSKPTTTMSMSSTLLTTSSTTSKASTTSTTTKPTTTILSTITTKPTTTTMSIVTTKPTTSVMTSSHPTAVLVVSTMSSHTTSMTTSTPMTTKTTTTITTKTTIVGTMATTSAVTVHVVKVSDMNNTLVFTPNSLVAAPGSLVQFQFFPMNHSVVQAAFSNPCTPIKNIMPSVQGIFSGFMPTNGIISPIFTILINDTQPIWYYCSQGMHCQLGMVGVINPPANETIAEFAALAKTETTNITPTTIINTTIKPSTGMPMPTTNSSMTTPPLALQTKNAAPASFASGFLSSAVAALVMVAVTMVIW